MTEQEIEKKIEELKQEQLRYEKLKSEVHSADEVLNNSKQILEYVSDNTDQIDSIEMLIHLKDGKALKTEMDISEAIQLMEFDVDTKQNKCDELAEEE